MFDSDNTALFYFYVDAHYLKVMPMNSFSAGLALMFSQSLVRPKTDLEASSNLQ